MAFKLDFTVPSMYSSMPHSSSSTSKDEVAADEEAASIKCNNSNFFILSYRKLINTALRIVL